MILARAVLPRPYPLPLGEGQREGRTSILSRASISLGTLLFILIHATLANALEVPPLKGRVNDYAALLPSARAQVLEQRLEQFESQTGHQIAVLTIPSLQGDALESFSIRVAENWKIGKKKFDNGAILLIAQNDRKLRIEVGYGLEGVLPDAIANRIIQEIVVPRFRANDFTGGVEAGVEAIMKVTSGEPLPRRSPSQPQIPDLGLILTLSIIAAFITFSIGITRSTSTRAALSGGAVAAGMSVTGLWRYGLWLPIISLLVGAAMGAMGNIFATRAFGRPWNVRGSRPERWARDAMYGAAEFGGGGGDSGGGGGSGGGDFGGGGGGFGGGGASGGW